jgi:hypothetical protein
MDVGLALAATPHGSVEERHVGKRWPDIPLHRSGQYQRLVCFGFW